jgi:membrane protein DedA with SNARE-associated domain
MLTDISPFLHHWGLGAVMVVLFVESWGIPSPDEIVLVLSGLMVAHGQMSYPLVILTATAASTLGASGAYWLARRGGRRLLLRRVGWLFRNPEQLARWERYFQSHGELIVLGGRIISGVRAVISYPAGLFEMAFWRFVLYTALGSLIWAVLAVTLGDVLGPRVLSWLHSQKRYEWAALGLVVLAAAIWWYQRHRQKRHASAKP